MYRALAWKELRETIGIVLLAAAAYALLVAGKTMPNDAQSWAWMRKDAIPFVIGDFFSAFVTITLPFVIALGLWQTLRDGIGGTHPFLLQRPMDRAAVFGLKILVGTALYLGVAGLPVLLYAWWASVPGHHIGPFQWSMTQTTWAVWLRGTLLHLGAFLAGLRPGRWFGTRLLPLAAAVVLFAFSFAFDSVVLWTAIVLALDLAFLACIFLVVRQQDF